uniref:Uncharacterized protein n=1 Tax=Zea mays TaxID=4577 RepID=Q5GAR0_MAIZE|nr:unknown [Zea mays]
MYREALWQKRGRPRELYPDVSSKDAHDPPKLPVPNCDCDKLAWEHLRCFFQWIDGHDKFDPRYLLFANWLCGKTSHERFKRWVPPPPNPPPMTDAEKEVATERKMDLPPRCDCGDRAVIDEEHVLTQY